MKTSLTGTWMAINNSSSILGGGNLILTETKGQLSGSGTFEVSFSMPGSFASYTVEGTVSGSTVNLKYSDGVSEGNLTGTISDQNHFTLSGSLSLYGDVNFSCRRISVSYANEITGVWKGAYGSSSQDITLYISQLKGGGITGIVQTEAPWVMSEGSGVTYPNFSLLISRPNISIGKSTFSGTANSENELTASLTGTLNSDGDFKLTRN